MSFRVSGKNLDLGDALRERISDRIAETVGKYFDGGYSGHVTLARDGFGFRTECAIHLDSKITLHAEGMASDAYASADQAALRIEKRLRRYHRRLKDHRIDRTKRGIRRAIFASSPNRNRHGQAALVASTHPSPAELTRTAFRLDRSPALARCPLTPLRRLPMVRRP